MGVADKLSQMKNQEDRDKKLKDFEWSVLPPEDGWRTDFTSQIVVEKPSTSLDYFKLENINALQQFKSAEEYGKYRALIQETLSLIPKEKWKESPLTFDKSIFSVTGSYDKMSFMPDYRFKVKDPFGDECIVTWKGKIQCRRPPLHRKLFASVKKQQEQIMEEQINHYLENIKAALSGSQQYVSYMDFVLFKDGCNNKTFYSGTDLSQLENFLAQFVMNISK